MRGKVHLLVVVAEGVGDAQFGNIHQSSLGIPGVAIKNRKHTAGAKLEEEITS